MKRLLSTPEGTFNMKHIGAVTPRTVPDFEDPSKNVVLATLHLNGGQVIETSESYEYAADALADFAKAAEDAKPADTTAPAAPSGT